MIKVNSKLSMIIFASLILSAGISALFTLRNNDKRAETTTTQQVAESAAEDKNYTPSIVVETETDVLQQLNAPKAEKETETAEIKEKTAPKEKKKASNKPKKKMVINISEDDYYNLIRIVEAEATDCDIKGKILVANVIINRVKRYDFPSTVTDVIFQGDGEQFSPISDGRFYSVTVTSGTEQAVRRALYGEDYSQGATYFATLYASRPGTWHSESLVKLFEYGDHAFFDT